MNNRKNSIWLGSQYLLVLFISLANLKLNLMAFGVELFSIWLMLVSLWGLAGSLDFGFGTSTIRFVALYKENIPKMLKILGSSLVFYIFFGLLILLFILGIGKKVYLDNHTLISLQLQSTVTTTFLYMAGQFYVTYLSNFFKSILEGQGFFLSSVIINIVNSLLIFAFSLMIYYQHGTILHLAQGYLTASIIGLVLSILIVEIRYPLISIRKLKFEGHSLVEIFKFSSSVQLTYFMNASIDPLIKYIIGTFYDKNFIPSYEIARKFASAISGLFHTSFKFLLTSSSSISSTSDKASFVLNTLSKTAQFGVLYSVLMFGVLSPFYLFTFDKLYGQAIAYPIFMILCLSETVNIFGSGLYTFIVGTGGVRFLALLQLLNITLSSTLLLVSVHYYNSYYGLIGFFLSSSIGSLLMTVYIKKGIGIPLKVQYKNMNLQWETIFIICLLLNLTFVSMTNDLTIIVQLAFASVSVLFIFLNFQRIYNLIIRRKEAINEV